MFNKSSKKSSSAPAPQQLPPSIAHEVMLMQFMGGGSLEKHAKRVMEQQAREMAPAGHPHAHRSSSSRDHSGQGRRKSRQGGKGDPLPIGKPFRDEHGNMWWDEDEPLEFKGLLASTHAMESMSPISTTFSTSSDYPQRHRVMAPVSDTAYPDRYAAYPHPHHIPTPPRDVPHSHSEIRRSRQHSASHAHHPGGFEDSFMPPPTASQTPLSHACAVAGVVPPPNDMRIKKTGMNLRGRARALFGGH